MSRSQGSGTFLMSRAESCSAVGLKRDQIMQTMSYDIPIRAYLCDVENQMGFGVDLKRDRFIRLVLCEDNMMLHLFPTSRLEVVLAWTSREINL